MFLLLIMCAITSLILGLGLTTTSCYIFLAILVAPALEKLGLNRMAVHMFIFYWGMLSSITPPVAIASFAAAGIAGAPAMKTGWESMWVGSIIYFIPFFFVLNPALLLQGESPYLEALGLTAVSCFGIVFICGGIQGYQAYVGDLRRAGFMEWPLRVLLIIGGFTIATPGGRHHADFAIADHGTWPCDSGSDGDHRPATDATEPGHTEKTFGALNLNRPKANCGESWHSMACQCCGAKKPCTHATPDEIRCRCRCVKACIWHSDVFDLWSGHRR